MAEREVGKAVQQDGPEDQIGRRGLLSWAVACAGAAVAWLSRSERVEATHGAGTDLTALHVNQNNPGTARTFLSRDVVGDPLLICFNGTNPFSHLLGCGLEGTTEQSNGPTGFGTAGVFGRNASGNTGSGVYGTSGPSGTGVTGAAGPVFLEPIGGVGVYGHSTANGGMGVRGRIPTTNNNPNTIGVYGENFSSNAGAGPGAGGFGCYGFSSLGHGLVGATGTAGGSAVVGATNGVAGAFAGVFFGPLVVVGGPKSAAAPHPDGGHRLLYCVESPESWFEDFGNARLVRGAADIKIDPDFVAVADTSSYNVFLTPYGDSTGLFVAERTPNGFVVEEHNCGTE